VGILDKAITKLRREGAQVEIVGLNEPSAAMVRQYAEYDKTDPANSSQ